jgi:hypothetical protein
MRSRAVLFVLLAAVFVCSFVACDTDNSDVGEGGSCDSSYSTIHCKAGLVCDGVSLTCQRPRPDGGAAPGIGEGCDFNTPCNNGLNCENEKCQAPGGPDYDAATDGDAVEE